MGPQQITLIAANEEVYPKWWLCIKMQSGNSASGHDPGPTAGLWRAHSLITARRPAAERGDLAGQELRYGHHEKLFRIVLHMSSNARRS
jgi:hypothetical protein